MLKLKHLLISGLVATASFAFAVDYPSINKDMRIMKRIIETALNESQGRRLGSRIDATYLARQGMVFTINASNVIPMPSFDGDWEAWGESVGESALSIVQSVVPAIEPIAPEAAMELEAELAEGLADLSGENIEAREQLRAELELLREQLRDSKENLRDNLRELRDIERERYRSDAGERERLDKRRAEIEKRIEKNKQGMNAYKEKMDEYRKARDKKVRERKVNVINNTIQTLCDYSASLKNLPRDEHVTLIFNNYADEKGKSDRIYVFKRGDVVDCDRDDVQKLIRKAYAYQQ